MEPGKSQYAGRGFGTFNFAFLLSNGGTVVTGTLFIVYFFSFVYSRRKSEFGLFFPYHYNLVHCQL